MLQKDDPTVVEKCRSLYREVQDHVYLIEDVQRCSTKIANATGDSGGTRIDAAELRDMYQSTCNAVQGWLNS